MTNRADYSKHSACLAAIFIIGDAVITLPDLYYGGAILPGFFIAAAFSVAVYFLSLLLCRGLLQGGIFKKILLVLFLLSAAVYAFWNGAHCVLDFLSFADKILLPGGEHFAVAFIFLFAAAVLSVKKNDVILKLSLIIAPFFILAVIIFFLLTAKNFEFENIALHSMPTFTELKNGTAPFLFGTALPAVLIPPYLLRFYMLMSGQVYPLDISLENLKDRLGIPADKYKDKNGKDRIDHFEERVLKPAKAALDESCPYTFNYVKVRENPNNKRSKVTGFRFYPVYQPQFRDEELEGKELQAKVTARYQIDSHVYEYLRYSCGFTSEEINRNKETFITAQEKITDLIGELALLNGKSREKNNPKGWIINALKGKIKDK